MQRFFRAWLCLLLLPLSALAGPSQVGGRVSPDKAEAVTVDLPGAEHLRNAGGRDGLGLCVYTSVEHAGRWQNAEVLRGFQQKMRAEPGGGWPEKLDRMMQKYAPGVGYTQSTSGDAGLLGLALATGRCPAVTYGYSPRYGGPVAHMVNLVHLSDRWACVLDNNFPGENAYEWMSPDEFLRRWRMSGGGWCVVVLNPGPPPIPVNQLAVGSWQLTVAREEPALSSLPTACGPPPEALLQNFGLDLSKINGEPAYSINGKKATAAQVWQAVRAGGTLVDDGKKWRLTVSGTPEECRRVLDDLAAHPALAAWRDRLLVQAYRPEAWALAGVNFPRGGRPTVVLQPPPDKNGKAAPAHAQHDYADGADGLAAALREADPNFDPKKVPDLRKKPAPPEPPEPKPEPQSPEPAAAPGDAPVSPILAWAVVGELGAIAGLLAWAVFVRKKG